MPTGLTPTRTARRQRWLGATLLILLLFATSALPAPAEASPAPADQDLPAADTARVGPFTFAVGPYSLQSLPIERLPDYGSTLASCGLTDPSGVAMYRAANGVIYDHPVAQARCAAYMMRNYRLTNDPAYLEKAAANGMRLRDRAVSHAGGIFFPYPFDFNNPGRKLFRAPWYSAMAQGLALQAFVRLFEWTGDAGWMQAADRTFASFKVQRSAGGPWVAAVENGLLWLDEYPTDPLDKTFNGHNFATFGLYDYWRVTGNAEARVLTLGAMHSAHAGAAAIRVPGALSRYCFSQACLTHNVRNPAYQRVHIGQFLTLFRMTGHWHFASAAETFTADLPHTVGGRASLAAGAHGGYTFDAAGVGTRVRTVTMSAATSIMFDRRDVPGSRVRSGNGIWLRVSEGGLDGLWVREDERAWPLGFVDDLDFYWNREVHVAAGSYAGTTYDGGGSPTGSIQASTSGATWSYTRYARVNGRPSVLVSTGPLAGRWLTLDRRTVRDSTLFADVDASPFRTDIIWLSTREITRGCGTFLFCPAGAVTRDQMSSFLVRALGLPGTSRDYFVDDRGSTHEGDINRLAASSITAGCAPARFCPRAAVTRDQMASFLARALRLPPATRDHFTDDEGSAHEADINRLADSGVTDGCGPGRFCPRAVVTREQMAAFLRRALTRGGGTSAANELDLADRSTDPSPATSPTPTPVAAPGSPAPSATPSPTPKPTPSSSSQPPSESASPTPGPSDSGTPGPSPSPDP